jgi:hypothetical protein
LPLPASCSPLWCSSLRPLPSLLLFMRILYSLSSLRGDCPSRECTHRTSRGSLLLRSERCVCVCVCVCVRVCARLSLCVWTLCIQYRIQSAFLNVFLCVGYKVPSSLSNIFKELGECIEGFRKPTHGHIAYHRDHKPGAKRIFKCIREANLFNGSAPRLLFHASSRSSGNASRASGKQHTVHIAYHRDHKPGAKRISCMYPLRICSFMREANLFYVSAPRAARLLFHASSKSSEIVSRASGNPHTVHRMPVT